MKEIKENLKGAFPFRLGTTSYIVPADIMPNLEYLRDQVDDVELVLFESDAFSNMPSQQDVNEMKQLAKEANLTYTVHLPLDIHLGSTDPAERTASVGKCHRVIERMAPLDPFAWILHLHGDGPGDPPTDDLQRWIEQNQRSLNELLRTGPAARSICIETLSYDFDLVAELVEAFDLSVCLDIGHLLVHGRHTSAYFDRWFDRTRVLHVHGVNSKGKDHCHLGLLPEGLLEEIAVRINRSPQSGDRVLTMEIFGEDDFNQSMTVVAERLATWRK